VSHPERPTRLEIVAARLQREMALKDRVIPAWLDRIDELEGCSKHPGAAGNRQAAPFSNVEPQRTPETPGLQRL
jgi:hypothetical protein